MRWTIVIAAGLLTACTSAHTPKPPVTDHQTPVVVCAIPAGMTEHDAEPARPTGDYTQRDVGRYLQALHRWGQRGWLRLTRVDARSRACQTRALAPEQP